MNKLAVPILMLLILVCVLAMCSSVAEPSQQGREIQHLQSVEEGQSSQQYQELQIISEEVPPKGSVLTVTKFKEGNPDIITLKDEAGNRYKANCTDNGFDPSPGVVYEVAQGGRLVSR